MCKIAYLFLCKGFKILKLIYMSLLFSEDFSDEQSCIQYFEKIRCPERFSPLPRYSRSTDAKETCPNAGILKYISTTEPERLSPTRSSNSDIGFMSFPFPYRISTACCHAYSQGTF